MLASAVRSARRGSRHARRRDGKPVAITRYLHLRRASKALGLTAAVRWAIFVSEMAVCPHAA